MTGLLDLMHDTQRDATQARSSKLLPFLISTAWHFDILHTFERAACYMVEQLSINLPE